MIKYDVVVESEMDRGRRMHSLKSMCLCTRVEYVQCEIDQSHGRPAPL